jgi:hypothetical protein
MESSIIMWNRLEPSTQNENQLEQALRFEVRDALWMLARQWQFGELDGEDAGTLAFAQIKRQSAPVQLIGSSASPQGFDYANMPYELPIERVNVIPDLHLRLEMGRHWLRLLKKRLPAAKYQPLVLAYKNHVDLQFEVPDLGDLEHQFQEAHQLSDEAKTLTLEAISQGRMLDGYQLYTALINGKLASSFVQPDAEVDNIGKEFRAWFEQTYNQSVATDNVWHQQHLEYQPQLAFKGNGASTHFLRKEEYYGDGISWHGFDRKSKWNDQNTTAITTDNNLAASETVIPANVRFRGMPSTRLWEMEDATVDFGDIRASSTELSKMLYAEFGLIYGNDWLVAPLSVPSGSFSRVSSLMTTDIFGKQSMLEEIAPNNDWAFFQTPNLSTDNERWLFMANGAEYAQESDPVEKVSFVRDEMANTVWGVEAIVSSPTGGGRDGEKLARQVAQWLHRINLTQADPNDTTGKLSDQGWIYKAGIALAEHRIPFIPVANTDTKLDIRTVLLQRAALPRITDLPNVLPVRVRPRTSILGNIGQIEAQKLPPFYIFEEEIPRSGAEVKLVWKRTRWFDGRTYQWLAYKKNIGMGEVDAHFKFDVLGNG